MVYTHDVTLFKVITYNVIYDAMRNFFNFFIRYCLHFVFKVVLIFEVIFNFEVVFIFKVVMTFDDFPKLQLLTRSKSCLREGVKKRII